MMSPMAMHSPAVSISGFDLRAQMHSPAVSPTKKRVRTIVNASKTINLDMLRPHFEKPLAEVAAMFGICMTLMKKICRKNGVNRWPHRQIRGLRKSIWSIEKALRCCDSESQRRSYEEHLRVQKVKLTAVLAGPDGTDTSTPRSSEYMSDYELSDMLPPLPYSQKTPTGQMRARPSIHFSPRSTMATPMTQLRSPMHAFSPSSCVQDQRCHTPTIVRLPPISMLLSKTDESPRSKEAFQF
ncbi:TPA: hypothetical protein N0F65_004931 [Lagenidium giganteum]|uniref:RWP-RK domain-containing protein n=1 Tax=Lagenidium giganteum TaxID=4803 RepID=A0AAV2YYW8_9STRA|nr:TPA: hypothetical protein N0F65_004931 [Lagenidium giganteum]